MWNKIMIFLFIGAIPVLLFWGCKESKPTTHESAPLPKTPQLTTQKLYHCPMHPTYTSDKPGDCPICYMKLVKIETETQEEFAEHGQVEIKISPERQQLIGVKIEEVDYRNLKKIVRASARVAYDTELFSAISEYKSAFSAKEKVKESPWPEIQQRADALVRASALRLRQLGLSEEQIQNLQKDHSDSLNLLLGEKGGSVWIYAQVYEYEAGLIQVGQTMEITVPALPGKKFFGSIKAVDSILNSESRSLRVRAEVPNPEGLLKPEMFVNAKIIVDLGWKLSLPEEAVMHTGERQIVFVLKEGGRFEPREVRLGQEAEGYYEVISGLKKGEKVVTSANFLLDSESKLKAALAGMGEHKH